MSIELPRKAGSVILSEGGVWFVLYPPDEEQPKWQWLSAGGDLFLSEYDSVKKIVALAEEWTDVYGEAPVGVGTNEYHL